MLEVYLHIEQGATRLWRVGIALPVVSGCLVGKLLDCPNREAVEPEADVRGINTTRIEVQVVAVGLRVQRG